MAETCSTVALSQGGAVTMVIDEPDGGAKGKEPALVLAHGAGNDCRSAFLEHFASKLSAAGIVVVRFNFPYKERTGTRPPDRMPVLLDTMQDVIAAQSRRTGCPPGPLFIGGKSMGARAAVTLAAAGRVKPFGVVCLGFPLHKPGEQDKLRGEDLPKVKRPVLFVQGTRDPFCTLSLLRTIREEGGMSGALVEIEGGGHSFELPASKAAQQQAAMDEAAGSVYRFIRKVLSRSR